MYDPFARGPFAVESRTLHARDESRDRLFPCEVWSPKDAPESAPLILYSHPSGANRRAASFLCTHLSSHGYRVAALDHSETLAPELKRPENETEEQRVKRWDAVIANRVPDILFLLERMLKDRPAEQVGIVGHSFGGWTALAATEVERRFRAVVALAPAGSSNPKPGILPVKLAFKWDVPTLYLVAENDTSLPLAGMVEIFERTPARKRMVILCRADHMHFVDDVEQAHEAVRKMPFPIAHGIRPRPIAELTSGEVAHLFVRGLALSHFDATLRGMDEAARLLEGDLKSGLAARGIDALVQDDHRSQA